MQSRWIYCQLAVLTTVCVIFGITGCSNSNSKEPHIQDATKSNTSGAPKLLKVSVYMWGEGTGWIGVNLTKGELEAYTFWPVNTSGLSESEAKKFKAVSGITVINATFKNQQTDAVAKLVKDSKLRSFQLQPDHINERMPNLDECPPSLVLTWSDKEEVFSLPLRGTVKKSVSKDIQQRYIMMEKIVDEIFTMAHKYNTPSTASVISYVQLKKSAKYKNYEKERNRLFGS